MKKLLFSVTASDCEFSYTKGSGPGGQARNKTANAVHCHHRPSGGYGFDQSERSLLVNKQRAFRKMAESPAFKKWHRLETMRRMGTLALVEDEVNRQMNNVRIEYRVDGKWVEESDGALR